MEDQESKGEVSESRALAPWYSLVAVAVIMSLAFVAHDCNRQSRRGPGIGSRAVAAGEWSPVPDGAGPEVG